MKDKNYQLVYDKGLIEYITGHDFIDALKKAGYSQFPKNVLFCKEVTDKQMRKGVIVI